MGQEKVKKTRVFVGSADNMLKMFEGIQALKQIGFKDTESLRVSLLNELSKQGHMKTVYDTTRTKEQIIQDYKDHGYTIDDRREK